MEHHLTEHTALIGTLSGTALTIIVNLESHDVVKTAVLACVGAIVSFCITLFLKWVVKKIKDVFSK